MSPGSHTPVLLHAAVDSLKVRADGVYVDCTFGRGGHSREILARLGRRGRVIALDRDPAAIAARGGIDDERLLLVHQSFSGLRDVLQARDVAHVDGILLDLGVSSPQLDDARRGFSFRFDAPLDMRMDTSRGATAAEWLASADEQEIREVIRNYGEERFAKQIAAAVVAARARGPVATTRQLAGIVAKVVRTREPGQDPATRTFQALRIHVNQELEELTRVLPQCVAALAPGGRLVVISFHSLEDRIVKRFLREHSQPPQLPPRAAVARRRPAATAVDLVGKMQRPGADEVAANPRARSAVMRIAERTAERAALIARLNLILLAILVACALSVVTSQHKARKLYVELQKEQELAKQLEIEWGQLQLEQSTWAMHARIEKIASGQLMMRVPPASRVQVVAP